MGQWKHESSPLSVVIEDNGRVAYAYLLDGSKIIADVWLYNRQPAPATPEWRDPSLMPFANARDYADDHKYGPIKSETDVSVSWENGTATISIHGNFWARLKQGDRPGECILAKKDGPLAKVFTQEAR